MKTNELLVRLQKLIAEHPEAADMDVLTEDRDECCGNVCGVEIDATHHRVGDVWEKRDCVVIS